MRLLKVFLSVALLLQCVMPAYADAVKVVKDVHLEHGWDFYTSHTECGGLRRDGKPQQPCEPTYATYRGPAIGSCPAGSFFDAGLWQCWSCPAGFTRGLAAVDSDRACVRTATWAESKVTERFKKAIFLGPLCPNADSKYEKSFFDTIRGGECWACPKGYRTNVLPRVDASNKCTRPAVEDFKPVNRFAHGTGLLGTDCPGGQFWDGIDGFCYACPSGYSKLAFKSVRDPQACHRVIPADDKPATVRGIGKCEAGTITDPRNGGECWKCPETYDRVLLKPIDSPQACETTPGQVFSRAKFVSALTCPSDQVFDFIAVNDSMLGDLKRRGLAAGSTKAAPHGGTCWSCPAEHKRTFAPVTDPRACQGEVTEWYSAPMGDPGLFGLPGAENVVLEILQYDRAKVDAAVKELVKSCAANTDDPAAAAGCKKDPDGEAAKIWAEIADTPGSSSLLMNMAFGRVELAATAATLGVDSDVRKPTAADKQLLASFADYVRKRRLYVANEALKAFDAWKAADAYWKNFETHSTQGLLAQKGAQNASKGANQGPDLTQVKPSQEQAPPPDWDQIVQTAMIASVSGATAIAGGVAIAATTNPALRKLVWPGKAIRQGIKDRVKNVGESIGEKVGAKLEQKVAQTTIQKTAGKLATEGLEKALSKAASSVFKFLKAAGPAFVIAAVIEAVIEVATKLDEYSKTDRNHVLAMVAQAGQPVDLTRDFLTDEGRTGLQGYWALAMSGISDPSAFTAQKIKDYAAGKTPAATPQPQVTNLGTTVIQNGPTAPASPSALGIEWLKLPGRAHDIAVAADGTAWVIGDIKVPGGMSIHFLRPGARDWGQTPGGAVRIAVAGTTPWLVNDGGVVFERKGNTWAAIPAPKARDIGGSAKGDVWIVADPVVGRSDYTVYRWTGSTWQSIPGIAGVRVAVDRFGTPWVVDANGGIKAFVQNRWVVFNGRARDIAVDSFGAPIVVDWDGRIQVFDTASNKWVPTGRPGAAVAAAGGKFWYLGQDTEVYRQK